MWDAASRPASTRRQGRLTAPSAADDDHPVSFERLGSDDHDVIVAASAAVRPAMHRAVRTVSRGDPLVREPPRGLVGCAYRVL